MQQHCFALSSLCQFKIKNPKMPKGEGKNPKLSLMHQALKLHVPDAFWLSTRFDYYCYYY